MQRLTIKNLKVYYHLTNKTVKAVDGVDLEGEGDLAIVGESGCGKSTLAHTIVRLLPKSARVESGDVLFHGTNLLRLKEDEMRKVRYKRISIVFQGAMNVLNPLMKVENQVAEVITIHKNASKKEALAEAGQLLEMAGIPASKGESYPHQLSGGQKQRIVIAMAIACDPELIIADEPFTALDVMIQAQLIELLKELKNKIGCSLILITHDLPVVGELCDKIAVMYAGKILEYGSLKTILRNPVHPYTRALLRATPSMEGEGKDLVYIPGSPPDLTNPPPGCRFSPRCTYCVDSCVKEEPRIVEVEEDHYASCTRMLSK